MPAFVFTMNPRKVVIEEMSFDDFVLVRAMVVDGRLDDRR